MNDNMNDKKKKNIWEYIVILICCALLYTSTSQDYSRGLANPYLPLMFIAPAIVSLIFSQILTRETFIELVRICNRIFFLVIPLRIATGLFELQYDFGLPLDNLVWDNFMSSHFFVILLYFAIITLIANKLPAKTFGNVRIFNSKFIEIAFVAIFILLSFLPLLMSLFFNNKNFLY